VDPFVKQTLPKFAMEVDDLPADFDCLPTGIYIVLATSFHVDIFSGHCARM
jgi:hypothetical protein